MNNPRPYNSPSDLDAMRALLSTGRLSDMPSAYVHPGDLNWWWFYHDRDLVFPENTYIWEEDGKMVGWTLNWNGEVDVYLHPKLLGTPEAAAMYTWAEKKALETLKDDQEKITFGSVSDADAFTIAYLESRGFIRDEKYLVHHSRPLDDLPKARVAEGYTLRGIAGEHEWPSRAFASKAAFGVKREWDDYLQNFLRFARSPAYERERDVVAVAPDGEIGAFAVCWFDPITRSGLFEPVGTHPDHQRRGLGRAVLYEGMRRMKANGMTHAEVCAYVDSPPARGLYTSVGFVPNFNWMTYSKKVQGPEG